ncbi:hypothetical protein CASFOL_015370 [Castilleja foliolosa]|uniref:AAA+ ATPase domain-containing protein n=1 Tax=Castilleja foliolosa TaxID=1961234 RepID=A0ABD3DFC3_9LAMI
MASFGYNNSMSVKEKMDAFDKELSNIAGLNGLKSQLQCWAKQLMLDERRRALGLEVGNRKAPHMAFLGNPGTGKTMVARLLGKLLHIVGILSTDKVVEVQRTDLVATYIFQTRARTRDKIKQAEGGILFVDEAYRLMPAKLDCTDHVALVEIMSFMDGGKVVVIFAGNKEEMERVISTNEGFRRRVTKCFYFDNCNCTDLANIVRLKMTNSKNDQNSPVCGFKLHPSCTVSCIAESIKEGSTETQRNERNGGLVDMMLVNARESLDKRIDIECGDTSALTTITLEDLRVGLRQVDAQKTQRIISGSNDEMTLEAKMDAFDKELSNIAGLKRLKSQLQSLAKQLMLDERRRALGLKVGNQKPPHMAFLGNPRTGQTMVARLLGKLLHILDILPTDKVVEVQRTDLVATYFFQTREQTRDKIKPAEGGILFVDEAHRLVPAKLDCTDHGLEALEEIMSFMDSGKVVVIFAGYCDQMERVISANEGFRRRVTKSFYFDNFTCTDLANILCLQMSNFQNDQNSPLYGFKLHPSCTVSLITESIRQGSTEKQRNERNGGLVDMMLLNARESLDKRIDIRCGDTSALTTITLEDLRAGLRQLEEERIILKGEDDAQKTQRTILLKGEDDDQKTQRIILKGDDDAQKTPLSFFKCCLVPKTHQ